MRILALLFALATSVFAEIRTMTLKQAIDLALKQNPDLVVARLDEQRARLGVKIAKDPFVPKVWGGSGLAWTSGYPNSIEGTAPSIFQARTDMAVYNRYQSFQVAEARENARGAQIDSQGKTDDVVYRTASLFLDAEQSGITAEKIEQQIPSLEKVLRTVRARFQEGSELPSVLKHAELNLAKSRQRAELYRADQEYAESSLAVALGYPPSDRVRPTGERLALEIPDSEESVAETAIKSSKEIRRLESAVAAKGLEVRSQRSLRWPQFDLVAQYALFAQYNYQDFFRRFQRHNGQLGVAIKVPLIVGSAAAGLAEQAEADISKLRVQLNSVRSRIALDAKKGFQDLQRAEGMNNIAKLDLEVAREDLSVLLAKFGEGQAQLSQVEQARVLENEKWIAFYNAQHLVERARLNLLRQTGSLVAALR